jgi:hypothetical protein
MDIIGDFVKSATTYDGCGFFKGDVLATRIAQKITKSQRKKFLRYGEIPGPFFLYLKEMGVLSKNINISAKAIGRTAEELADLLWNCSYDSESAKDAGEYLRKLILTFRIPMLEKSYSGIEHVWNHLERNKKHGIKHKK